LNFLDHFMKRLFTLRFGFKSQSETILGDLPLVGNLFKKQMRTRDKREILIFITPKIIDN